MGDPLLEKLICNCLFTLFLLFFWYFVVCSYSRCIMCFNPDTVVFPGASQGLTSLVQARVGASAELSCSLTPTSKESTTPNLFPLHVVEWVRLGYNVPILIKFGVYAPRVHPNYKGEHYSHVFLHSFQNADERLITQLGVMPLKNICQTSDRLLNSNHKVGF